MVVKCILIQQNKYQVYLLHTGYDLTIGSRGQKVQQIQEQLNTIGKVYTAIGNVNVDGIYGEDTQRAVRNFQKYLTCHKQA